MCEWQELPFLILNDADNTFISTVSTTPLFINGSFIPPFRRFAVKHGSGFWNYRVVPWLLLWISFSSCGVRPILTLLIVALITDEDNVNSVYALYLKNNKVFFLGLPLIAEHIVAAIVMIRSTVLDPSFSGYCDLNKTPMSVVPLGYVVTLRIVRIVG